MESDIRPRKKTAREGRVPAGNAELYYRDIGQGEPILILHGGPDFNHDYFLPEMDKLAEDFRLIYYDQRGRGRSGAQVNPAEVSLNSEMEDLERMLDHFRLESAFLLGHSWGALLAMEFAVRRSQRAAALILLNPAPASREDSLLFRNERRRTWPEDLERLKTIRNSLGYQAGDIKTEADYYRVHFQRTLKDPRMLDDLVRRLRRNFTSEGILKAREIEDRLYAETWDVDGYDLVPKLTHLEISALVLTGENDLVPLDCTAHIAEAVQGAKLVVQKGCGHFAFMECPEEVRREVREWYADEQRKGRYKRKEQGK